MSNKYGQNGTFTDYLDRLRWSYQDYADQTGVSLRTVKRWARENDKSPGKKVAMKYLELLCRIIGL